MFSKFNEEAKRVLVNAKKEMQDLKHPYIGSEHMLLSILKIKNSNIDKLKKYGITYKSFKDELIKIVGIGKEASPFFLYTPLLKNIISNAICTSEEKNKEYVDVDDLLLAIFDEGEGVAIRIILGMGINISNIYDELISNNIKPIKNSKLQIENFGVDLNKKALNNEIDPVVGRDSELKRVMEVLGRRTKNNPLLIGDAGVGKTAIVEELARRIVDGRVGNNLKNRKIISVSMSSLVAGTKYRGEFEERIGKIINELEQNSNIILFIDEIHTLVGAGGAEGAIDASNILKPALARGKLKMIGATTTEEYKKYIKDDKALDRRFQIIDINEPTTEVVKKILMKLKPIYEGYHSVNISEKVIDQIINLSNKFLYERKMPDKAIDVLDEACSKVAMDHSENDDLLYQLNREYILIKNLKNNAIINNNFKDASIYKEKEIVIEDKINNLELNNINIKKIKNVTIDDVKKIVQSKSKIPIFEMNNNVSNNLKNELLKVIVGQDEAIDKLCNLSKKISLGLKKEGKPISLLFVGETGVGKTYLAKEFANKFLGDSLVRVDMSEYKESHTISKIIGAPPGYKGYLDNKNVLEEIKEKPYSVVLLDEVDKANKSVMQLFLQILDEGKVKDSSGNTVRFDNNIIIMTANLELASKNLGFVNSNEEKIKEILNERLGSEIVNRVDEIIVFNNIDDKTITKIIEKEINNLELEYKDKGIKIKIKKEVLSEIKGLTEYEKYGARKVKKVISNYIENIIIDEMILNHNEITIDEIKIKDKCR